MRLLETARTWGRMVKFSHSLFALPFAISGAALAGSIHGISLAQVGWILAAMVGARNAAMGFNRLADHALDARNPRTASRELPRGALGRGAVWGFTIALSALFVLAAFQLNRLCGWLSLVALAVIFGYSYTKRFTWTSHLVLGLALAMAPVGGWLAVAGRFSLASWLLGGAVLVWVAGFDVVYACQDEGFDRKEGLFSIPARFGVRRSLALARSFHVAAFVLLAAVGVVSDLPGVYWTGLTLVGVLLVWQHSLLRPDDLSRLGLAFFNANGLLSVVYLVTILLSVSVE